MIIATSSNMNLGDLMKYEFRAYPTALFKTPEISMKENNPQLAHAIKKKRVQ